MIKNFKCKQTKQLWNNEKSRYFNAIARQGMRKLEMLHAASCIEDLRLPPGNRLEALSGDRQGQYSIRINQQYRICFYWNAGADSVEITDYH